MSLEATNQCYVMVAVLDDQGCVLAGFEREKCILKNVDAIDLPLRWGDQDTRALAGKKIRLRFFLRSARIYVVREAAG